MARRLYAVFERLAPSWKIDQQAFFRPALDPASLLADLPAGEGGRPVLPGTRALWSALFDEGHTAEDDLRRFAESDAPDVASLCDLVFSANPLEARRRYQTVLFASRIVPSLDPGTIVTVPRTFVDSVVTEHGTTNLQGLTQRERALALVDLAHPRFRADLQAAARRLFWPS